MGASEWDAAPPVLPTAEQRAAAWEKAAKFVDEVDKGDGRGYDKMKGEARISQILRVANYLLGVEE